jgi:hypothetical protein
MGVAWKSFEGPLIDVGAVDEPYSAYSAWLVGRPLAAGLERSGSPWKTNRDWTGDSQVERLYCAAPLLYTWSTSPSARLFTFYIFIMSSTPNPFTLHTAFSTPKSLACRAWYVLILLLFILLVPPPSPLLADACLVIGRT